ncbi:MAG: hypothetical protein AAF558_04265 [Verrucomicrobiota bacterium]
MKYEDLKCFANKLAKELDCGKSSLRIFGNDGLFLDEEPYESDYNSTPNNSLTFATTGGDGVHFGFVTEEGTFGVDSAIVMTVPMNFGNGNVIVGASLKEFIELGIYFGYFDLEQLSYDFETTSMEIDEAKERKRSIELDALSAEFDLKPWKNARSRLDELREQYYHILDIQDE